MIRYAQLIPNSIKTALSVCLFSFGGVLSAISFIFGQTSDIGTQTSKRKRKFSKISKSKLTKSMTKSKKNDSDDDGDIQLSEWQKGAIDPSTLPPIRQEHTHSKKHWKHVVSIVSVAK